MCDEIIGAPDSASTNVSCTVPMYAKNIVPTNFDDKKVRHKMDCCILHTVLLVVILLFIVAIIYCYYTNHGSKHKNTGPLTI